MSFFWALGVWVIGEGLGMLFTGTATALTGAPGSVFVYGCLGLMAWPRRATAGRRGGRRRGRGKQHDGTRTLNSKGWRASSAAGRGIGGAVTPLAVWSGYWVLAAVLVRASGQPDADFRVECDHRYGARVAERLRPLPDHVGVASPRPGRSNAWVLAIVSVVIGLGPC